MNKLLYSIKQGFRNFGKNPLFSIASVATVAACIFLCCMFMALVYNLTGIARNAESNVGITVFFTEEAEETEKAELKEKILSFGGVREINYISADDAWASFKENYFGDKAEELSAAFADDNPLAQSDSYEIFMEKIEDQPAMAEFLEKEACVREVNMASSLIDALNKVNSGLYLVSAVIIGALFLVSVFLISNTINVAAAFRKRENEIMRLIGGTNFMIKAPFVVEGLIIGILGAAIPLAGIYFLYRRAAAYLLEQIDLVSTTGALKEVASIIPVESIFPQMVIAGAVLGIGMGFVVSSVTINKHLRV